MSASPSPAGDAKVLDRADFESLFGVLTEEGYEVIGPTARDGAIVYEALGGVEDLPAGWTDEQDGGSYRLRRREDEALFGHNVGPNSWKGQLHPPDQLLWRVQRAADGDFEVEAGVAAEQPPRRAFLGVRSCDLHAISHLDDALLGFDHPDTAYAARRANVFVIAVNCGQAAGTCFCVSMQTGPRASAGFDLALTEVLDGDRHWFLVEGGSEAGERLAASLPLREARPEEVEAALAVSERTAGQMGRELDTAGIKELLYRNAEHPRWDEVSERCLTCGNCTMVCPTCFCTTDEDVTDLAGETAERRQRWDSCFTLDFSYVHGGSVRHSPKSRYRQWMTHKLASWIDQFGSSGCVGCGRCIAWCPVSIDITEEAAVIRATDGAGAPAAGGEEEA
jgi:ferredoxin